MESHAAVVKLATSVVMATVLATGCRERTSTEPSPLGQSVPLLVGQEYRPDPEGALRVSLRSVDEDARCPLQVMCVSAGTATITLGVRLGMGPTVPTALIWGNPLASSTTAGGLRVTFDSLTPWPEVPGPLLPQSRYTAWLTFSATPAPVAR